MKRIIPILQQPILRQIVLLILSFIVALMLILSVEFVFQHITSVTKERILNARAREQISDIILHYLIKTEMSIQRFLVVRDNRDLAALGEDLEEYCNILERGMNVLRSGGTFRCKRRVNFDVKNDIEQVIEYQLDIGGYDVDVIALTPKIMDLRRIAGEMVGASKSVLASDDAVRSEQALFDLRMLIKQAQTYLLRSQETANKIAYDVQTRLDELQEKDRNITFFLLIFRFSAWGIISVIVVIYGSVIIRKVNGIILAQRDAEISLRDRERYLRTIYDTTQTGLILIDAENHRLVDANVAACRMLETPKDEIIGRVCNECMCPLDDIGQCPMEVMGHRVDNAERILLRKGTERVPIIKSAVPIVIAGKNYFLESFIDISNQKKAQQELEDMNEQLCEAIEKANTMALKAEQANIAKSAFLANMSHEIRTPMNSILGFAEILQRRITDSSLLEFLNSIMVSGKTLLNLINDILDLSKVEAGKLKLEYAAVRPHEIFVEMRQIFSQHIERKNLEFTVNIAEDLPEGLLLDEVRLRQVLLNLIGNAVKFTDNGFVRLSVFKEDIEDNFSTIDLIFEVSDSGVGISQEQQQEIFQAFHQQDGQNYSKYGGTGLGLAICKRLVNLMGGDIRVESREGEGTTFRVLLHDVRIAAVLEEECEECTESIIEFEPADILIVDDIETNRNLLAGILEEFPFTLRRAENGEEALALIKERKPDILLLDIKMPVMDGNECAGEIRKNPEWEDIVIIVITASAVNLGDDEEHKKNIDCLLHKPISRLVLLNEIKRYVAHNEVGIEEESETKGSEDTRAMWPDYEMAKALLAELEKNCLVLYEEVRESLNVSKSKALAEEIKGLGTKYHTAALVVWADKLEEQALSFDIKKLQETLTEFEGITKKIREIEQ